MRQTDINFALTLTLNALLPPSKQQVASAGGGANHGGSQKGQPIAMGEMGRTGSMSSHSKRGGGPREMLQNVAFLGQSSILSFLMCSKSNVEIVFM